MRKDEKIRQQFSIRSDMWLGVLMRGHIYEQRNVMVTYNQTNGGHVSEQYSTIDALLQSIPLGTPFTIEFSGEDR